MDNPDNGWHGWQLLLIGSGPSAVVWLFGAWQFFVGRRDRLKKEDLSYGQQMQLELSDQRKSLNADQNMLVDRLRVEWERGTKRIDQLEAERDRAWDLVRYWYRYCESLVHQLRNVRFIAEGLARKLEPPVELGPFIGGELLPDMENPERATPSPPGTGGRGAGTLPPPPLKEPK